MPKRALLVVDVQNDFLPQGALGVPNGDRVISPINRLMQLPFDQIIATQDYHPKNHISFASCWQKKPGEEVLIEGRKQHLWLDHCVQGSFGAEFAPGLHQERFHKIIHKGDHPEVDSYSTFFDNTRQHHTELSTYLKEHEIEELFFTGLATDYCVLYSARDAVALGFKVFVVLDACCGIDLHKGDIDRAIKDMKAMSCSILTADEVESLFSSRLCRS